jgi:hypothetical protein
LIIDAGIQTISDFLSRECKSQLHESCHGKWEGLGFQIICSCKCGHGKNGQALEWIEAPGSNAVYNIQSNSKESVQRK